LSIELFQYNLDGTPLSSQIILVPSGNSGGTLGENNGSFNLVSIPKLGVPTYIKTVLPAGISSYIVNGNVELDFSSNLDICGGANKTDKSKMLFAYVNDDSEASAQKASKQV